MSPYKIVVENDRPIVVPPYCLSLNSGKDGIGQIKVGKSNKRFVKYIFSSIISGIEARKPMENGSELSNIEPKCRARQISLAQDRYIF